MFPDDEHRRCWRNALDREKLPKVLRHAGAGCEVAVAAAADDEASIEAATRHTAADATSKTALKKKAKQHTKVAMTAEEKQKWRSSKQHHLADPSYTHLKFNKQSWSEGELADCFASLCDSPSAGKVDFRKCRIGVAGAAHFARLFGAPRMLTDLYLYQNELGDAGAAALADAVASGGAGGCRLARLNLCDNGIGEAGAAALAVMLRTNTSLLAIDVNRNQLGDAGAAALAFGLEGNATLRTLSVRDNGIAAEGADRLLVALGVNTTLTQLGIDGNTAIPQPTVVSATASCAVAHPRHRVRSHTRTTTFPSPLIFLGGGFVFGSCFSAFIGCAGRDS